MSIKFKSLSLILISLLVVVFFSYAEVQDESINEMYSSSLDDTFSFTLNESLTSQYLYSVLDGQPDNKTFYDDTRVKMNFNSDWFDLIMDWGLSNDGEYPPEEKYFGGRYFAIYDTSVNIHTPDEVFSFTAGRGPHKDVVDTPYSVFINSNDLAAFNVDVSYDGDFFFFTDRWVQLTYRSMNSYQDVDSNSSETPFGSLYETEPYDEWENYYGTWLDKGANYKTFGIKLDNWRLGFQDVVIYAGRSFDAEYFFNPLPQYFVQLINSSEGRPWSMKGNAKSLMGFFADRTAGDSYISAQVLFDDLNMDFVPGFDQSAAIKTKIAWSIGGWMDFDFGRMGFYHGGATKYTFEATYTGHHYEIYSEDAGFIDVPYSILPYEATYSPSVEFSSGDDESRPIDYEDNYFCYKYGENNLAFMVDYQNLFFTDSLGEFGIYSAFEYVLNGAKSPANPWHEYYSGSQTDDRIVLLDGTVEHLLKLSAAIRKPLPYNLVFNLDLIGGVAINAMKLVSVTPVDSDKITYDGWEEPKIYTPQNGLIEPIFKLTLGLSWYFPVKK